MMTIVAGVIGFTLVVVTLAAVLMAARATLVSSGDVAVMVNDDAKHTLYGQAGLTLLGILSEHDIVVPSACGGRGTCGTCKVQVLSGGGPVHPVERSHISRVEAAAGMRLACQLVAKRDLRIVLPPEVLAAHEVLCRVRSNRNVATFIKEVVLELPEGESFEARAGSYIQVECPPYQLDYADIEVDARFERSWAQGGLRKLHAGTAVPATRAYSLASYPEERGLLMLNVRIATPPPDRPDVPPGVVSSYVFGLRAGDEVSVSGPFGTFFAQETDREMVFVGGGAGMAPMRALILDQLKRLGSKRRIGYWYGARSLSEAFYVELFEQLQREHDNFRWHLALSEPLPEDAWQGDTGFIHQVVLDRYLAQHPAPEDVEYYLCGPPPMVEATLHMLRELGVRADNIRYDVF